MTLFSTLPRSYSRTALSFGWVKPRTHTSLGIWHLAQQVITYFIQIFEHARLNILECRHVVDATKGELSIGCRRVEMIAPLVARLRPLDVQMQDVLRAELVAVLGDLIRGHADEDDSAYGRGLLDPRKRVVVEIVSLLIALLQPGGNHRVRLVHVITNLHIITNDASAHVLLQPAE